MRLTLQTALAALLSMSIVSSVSAKDITDLTQALVKKRAETERLTDEVERQKRLRREQQRAFASQKTQLEAELRRETVRHAQLIEAQTRKRAIIENAKETDAALGPVFSAGVIRLRAHIDAGVPFRKPERLKEVKVLEDRLKNGLLSPRNALTRLWSLVEDEQRMAKETGLFRDTVLIDGEPMMVDVIRIGTVGMYFKTGTDRVGIVTRAQDRTWATRFVDGESNQRQISTLFDAFKKQIKVGFFDLPNLFPVAEES